MKIIHLSDLHLGKRVNEFPMIEDQEYILTKVINIIENEKPDGVLIAGDVYDKSVPSAEAVQLFDDFLYRLSKQKLRVFIIGGNHDSPERIAFGSRLMDRSGIHMSPVYSGQITPISLKDEHGTVNVYMLPFVKPANIRRFYPDDKIDSYTDALCIAINNMNVHAVDRNILVTHQFVTGASRSDSEDFSVGGTDNVDVSVFAPFSYVALGHIHTPQNIGSESVRYCGTPLKYSFSEVDHEKSVTVVELGRKGELAVRMVPLMPRRDLRKIRGTYAELTLKSFYDGTSYPADYLQITLTDEEDVPNAIAKLRVIYPYLMKLEYDNKRTRINSEILGADNVEQKSPLELFCEFYEKQNNQPMTQEQQDFATGLIESIWEGGK